MAAFTAGRRYLRLLAERRGVSPLPSDPGFLGGVFHNYSQTALERYDEFVAVVG